MKNYLTDPRTSVREMTNGHQYSLDEIDELKRRLEYFESMEQVRLINEKFKYVLRELDEFYNDVHDTSFFGLFHKYTKEELMQSHRINKIHSILEKIGSDLSYWKKNKKLTIKAEYSYYINREDVINKTIDIENEIRERKPTFLEKIIEIFSDVMIKILKLIPPITKRLPRWFVKFLPRKVQNAISSMKMLYLSRKVSKYDAELSNR